MRPRVRFKQEIFDVVCDRLASGESLRTICSSDDMPPPATFLGWVDSDEKLAEQYTRARELQADAIFDEVIDIADDARNDWMEKNGPDSKRSCRGSKCDHFH